MPTIVIDGKEYEVPQGENILEACLGLGLDLPYFCWHPAMGSIGSCRQCAVIQYQNPEDERGKLVMGCMTPVQDGARFSINNEAASSFREFIIESLMVNHPHDCPVCAEGGECHLQDMTVMAGHRDRRYRGLKKTHRNQYLGPLIHHEMNRCITCYRCVRFYKDYAGGSDLSAMASHDHVYFGRHEDGKLESPFSGNLVEVCPTGVFTDKHLVNDYTRKWDLQSAPSICPGCSVGCNTSPGERYGKLKRVHNRYNPDINGYFLCDKGRFGATYVNSEKRVPAAGKRSNDGLFDVIESSQALAAIAESLSASGVIGIGSPRASLETNFALQNLVGQQNFCTGISETETALVSVCVEAIKESGAKIPSPREIERCDAILILGEDVTNTATRIALSLRQAVRNEAFSMAKELQLQNWQDAATRNLAQEERSPLFLASPHATQLDDIAEGIFNLSPSDIAHLGYSIASLIEGKNDDATAKTYANDVGNIAEVLLKAERPLIISGTGVTDASVIQAAGSIASALITKGKEPYLSLIYQEANTLGTTLLTQGHGPSLSNIFEQGKNGDIQTLIIVENDLYRRAAKHKVDKLLKAVDHVIVLDILDNETCNHADIVLPVSSFAECEGTLINFEGRAQRHFPVFESKQPCRPSWEWLTEIGKISSNKNMLEWQCFDDINKACSESSPTLTGINEAAPDRKYRVGGRKIPRQPHRYSGRTAMVANLSVHEPKQTDDTDTPLGFTMEGHSGDRPGELIPFVWAPGWNSNHSVHKLQTGSERELKGGRSVVKIESKNLIQSKPQIKSMTQNNDQDHFIAVAMYKIFGTGELSSQSPGITELCQLESIELTKEAADKLGVSNGDGVTANGVNGAVDLEVKINDSLISNCAGIVQGTSGSANINPGEGLSLTRSENWVRKSELISSDQLVSKNV